MNSTYTVEDLSTASGLSRQTIRGFCRNGKLKCKKMGNTWIIDKKIADSFLKAFCKGRAVKGRKSSKGSNGRPVVLSFFSGAMGLDIGLEESGLEVVLACEVDKYCRQTIVENKPGIALLGDIRDYTSEEIRDAANLPEGADIDVIVGGPPCQAFSTAGKRKSFEDERGNVFLTFIDRIIELKPKYVVLENVRGLLSAPLRHRPHSERGGDNPPLTADEQKGGALMHIIKMLEGAGYSVSFNLYNAANFGTPQSRERVVMLCSRDGIKMPYLEPTHSENGEFGLERWRTFKDAVEGLGGNLHHLEFPEKRLKYYRMLKPGQNWKSLPLDLQKEALGKSFFAGGGKTGFLRRLSWNRPSPTLVTHPAMPATDLAHPVEDRPLSIEEYKRIQEFPDGWHIAGPLIEQYRQIGNAVPIRLGKAIGTLLLKHMNGDEIKEYPGFRYSRYRNTDDVSWRNEFMKSLRNAKVSGQMHMDLAEA